MPKDLRITIVQTSLFWEDSIKNIRHFNKLLGTIKKGSTDVIILPEMFNTGFSMSPERLAEKKEGLTMQWMKDTAASLNTAICGSLIIEEKEKFYNCLVWMYPNGKNEIYNKRHLFRMAGENKQYTAGNKKVIIDYKGWKICPMVCYDLRFPIWSRNSIKSNKNDTTYEYDLLVYVANWPAIRSFAWTHLLLARAIENQTYVAGVNRIGKDGNAIKYSGNSMVLDMFGKTISTTKANRNSIETILLSYSELSNVRKKFPVLMDADRFTIKK